VIRLIGLVIQLKRSGLLVRRFFVSLGHALGKILSAWLGFLHWLLAWPRVVVGWLWSSLFWPVEETTPPCRRIAHLEKLSETPFAPSPSYWEQLQKMAGCSMCALRKSARVSSIQVRRAGLRAQRAVQKPTPWTLASVAGSLGVLLMIVVQVSYSFQSQDDMPVAPLAKEHPKTRIDPGFPQGRDSHDEMTALAQVDPFAPAEPNAFPEPMPEEAANTKPWSDPWDATPARDAVPANPAPPAEEEPWVDPLDMLPPGMPLESGPDPLANFPMPPIESAPPLEPMPSEFPPFDPPMTQSQEPLDPLPDFPASDIESLPPKAEPEPWIDPLDNLPPTGPVPTEQSPPVNPLTEFPESKPSDIAPEPEPEEFVDPLDNFPPFDPVPQERKPRPVPVDAVWPPMETVSPVELGVDFVRMPKDDEERFRQESGTTPRHGLAPEIQFDDWDRSLTPHQQEPPAQRPYWERISHDEKQRLAAELNPGSSERNYDIGPEESRAELTVGLEKHLPPKSTASEPLRYEIVVENRGREMIDAVDVDESVPPTHQLTDVSPAGYFEDNLLRWRLKELRPGEQRRLQVEVVPTAGGAIETTTSVRPSIQVASLTNVARTNTVPDRANAFAPSIRLRRSGYKVIGMDETVLFTNHVQNLSTQTQRDVEIVEEVPIGFRVVQVEDGGVYNQQAGTITWTLAELPQDQTIELGVLLKAEGLGELESRVKASASEGEAVPIRARVQVERIPARQSAPQAPCRCPCCCCAACRCR
jgi:hypothetical protein